MTHLETRFSQADREAINNAVARAESQTSAEIIPVIAASSGRYDRSEDICGLWAGFAAFFAVWNLLPVESQSASWATPSRSLQFIACVVAILIGFMLGTVVASRVNVLRRLFSPARQMRDEVQLRARAVFFDRRVHHTACATGIMLYISLFERMAIVLADQTVLDRLGQDQIDAMCAEFTQRLQMMQPIDALAETVQIVGQRLSDPLPRKGDDINELSDALVILN